MDIYIYIYICIREGNGNPPQYSCLGDPMDRGAWRATARGVAKSQTQPGNSTHTCIAEPLCCAPETITTLQINALQYKIKIKLKVQDFLTVTPYCEPSSNDRNICKGKEEVDDLLKGPWKQEELGTPPLM